MSQDISNLDSFSSCKKDMKSVYNELSGAISQFFQVIIIIIITDLFSAFRSEDTEALDATQED